MEEIRVAHVITALEELSSLLSVDVDKHFHDLGPELLIVAATGYNFSATESINAMKQRTRTVIALKSLFQKVDLIATPTTGCPIPVISPEYYTFGKVDAEAIGNLEIFTYLASFIGVPALTVPVGILNHEARLPVGMQLLAPWYQESLLIKCAMEIEASGLFPRQKPMVWYDLLAGAAY